MLAVALLLTFSACGEQIYLAPGEQIYFPPSKRAAVSQPTALSLTPNAEKFLAFPRRCDANRASAHPSWWLRIECIGEPSLPPECEKPGTYNLPACEGWILSQASEQQAQQSMRQAVLPGSM
jgi:hypothetical protein